MINSGAVGQLRWRIVAPAAVFVLSSFLVFAGAARAQSNDDTRAGAGAGAGADRSGRFTFQQTQDGVLRLDTQTGDLSICRSREGKWSCEVAADGRRTTEDELARLRAENAELKKDVKRLEELAGLPQLPDPDKQPGTGRGPGGVQLPTEEDLDKAMSYVQRMLKKFKDKIKEFENEMGKTPEPKKGTQL
jgi:hypothetical protein